MGGREKGFGGGRKVSREGERILHSLSQSQSRSGKVMVCIITWQRPIYRELPAVVGWNVLILQKNVCVCVCVCVCVFVCTHACACVRVQVCVCV